MAEIGLSSDKAKAKWEEYVKALEDGSIKGGDAAEELAKRVKDAQSEAEADDEAELDNLLARG
jgi:hypothetical protein